MRFPHAGIVFWFALGLSASSFVLFCYLTIGELRVRREEAARVARHHESMGKVGDLAEKFAKSGAASSALACTVFFTLMATIIGLTIDDLGIARLFRF